MDPFLTFWQKLTQILFTTARRTVGVAAHLEIDSGAYITERISFHTNLPCRIRQFRSQDFTPNLHRILVSLASPTQNLLASGTHPIKAVASIKAIAEAIERYSCFFPLNSLKDIRNDTFVEKLRNEKQLGRSLLGFRFKNISYQEIFFGFPNAENSYDPLREGTTNGCAAHTNKKDALANALLELIERDAFLLHWLFSITPKKIIFDPARFSSPEIVRLFKMLPAYGIECTFLDITSDIEMPVCLCVARKKSATGTRYFVGADSSFNFESMIVSSCMEALSNVSSHFEDESYVLPDDYKPFSNSKIRKNERLRIFFTHEMEKSISFLVSSNETITEKEFMEHIQNAADFGNGSGQQLTYLRSLFLKRYKLSSEWEVLVCHISNSLTKELGFYVVRIFCKALLSLYLTEAHAPITHARLQQYAQLKGLDPARLNPLPHPFP